MKRKTKIFFDVDGTLMDSKEVQEYCKLCVKMSLDVSILTSRYSGLESKDFISLDGIKVHDVNQFGGNYELIDSSDVYKLAEEVGIPLHKIFFTEGVYKAKWLKANNINDFILIDDSINEKQRVNEYITVKKLIGKCILVSQLKKILS